MRACHGSAGRSDVRQRHHVAASSSHSSSHVQGGNVAQEQAQHSSRGADSHGGGQVGAFHIAAGGSDIHSPLHHGERTRVVDGLPESQRGIGTVDSQKWGSHGERRLVPANDLHGLRETVIAGHSERQLTVNGQTVHREHEEWRRQSGADGSKANGFDQQAPSGSSVQRSLNR